MGFWGQYIFRCRKKLWRQNNFKFYLYENSCKAQEELAKSFLVNSLNNITLIISNGKGTEVRKICSSLIDGRKQKLMSWHLHELSFTFTVWNKVWIVNKWWKVNFECWKKCMVWFKSSINISSNHEKFIFVPRKRFCVFGGIGKEYFYISFWNLVKILNLNFTRLKGPN